MSSNGDIFCPNCGDKNPGDSMFCMSCGVSLPQKNRPHDGYDSQPAKGKSQPTQNQWNQSPQNFQRNQSQPDQFRQQEPSYQPHYQAPYQRRYQHGPPGMQYKQGPPGALSYICSFCVPPIGLVLYFVYKNDNPNKARDLLILTIIAAILWALGNA